MATKISQLDFGQVIAGSEVLPMVQSSNTKKVTAESLNTKPIFEIDLTSADFNITQYGIYYITAGSTGLTPYLINLPNPTTMPGTELILLNYDQTNDALFGGSYVPYLEASTSAGDKYNEVPFKQAVKIISINGYWAALNYKL